MNKTGGNNLAFFDKGGIGKVIQPSCLGIHSTRPAQYTLCPWNTFILTHIHTPGAPSPGTLLASSGDLHSIAEQVCVNHSLIHHASFARKK